MNTKQITELAIRRHDEDAEFFQNVYSGTLHSAQSQVFLYGRNMILEELEILLQTVPKGGNILDVGCGTGHLTNWLKEKGYHVCGVEPSEEMYQYAVNNFPGIDFKKSISSSLPFNDESFDLVIALEVLRYLEDEENNATYKEFYRVLKNDARIFVTHVNLFSTDGYFFFYNAISVMHSLSNKPYHFCNFTTPSKQVKMLIDNNYKNITTIGRMAGAVRIFYKFGNFIGNKFGELIKRTSEQRYTKGVLKSMAGHLIVIAQK
ncbi:methyltransferase domain-containing protein [Panacibacter ginsenosidivorans]|uniref:Methyltransferase domain-containing protein n=1 Tax=Panacibacter ginsenosidivorans TaxID=1813871 RepID=A0A5B8V852_9BACT|nr:class I SAM-dependent methyltransferase [Panacibacter ginsenosidivorans]QEC67083.1 methyltransferase domain-containing protein [Panacibacter ginsenosidivorans]